MDINKKTVEYEITLTGKEFNALHALLGNTSKVDLMKHITSEQADIVQPMWDEMQEHAD